MFKGIKLLGTMSHFTSVSTTVILNRELSLWNLRQIAHNSLFSWDSAMQNDHHVTKFCVMTTEVLYVLKSSPFVQLKPCEQMMVMEESGGKWKAIFYLHCKSELSLNLYGSNRVDIHFPQSFSLSLTGDQVNMVILCVSGFSHNLIT